MAVVSIKSGVDSIDCFEASLQGTGRVSGVCVSSGIGDLAETKASLFDKCMPHGQWVYKLPLPRSSGLMTIKVDIIKRRRVRSLMTTQHDSPRSSLDQTGV